MAEHLHLGRQAAHVAIENAPHACEAGRRVRPVAAVLHPVDAIAGVVELDGVDIHLPAGRVEQDDARRQLTLRHLVPLVGEHLDEQRHSRSSHDDVEVVVLAALLAK